MPTAASTPARDLLTRNWAKKVAKKLQSVLPNKPNDADLRHAVEPLFDGFCIEAGIPPLAHAEFSLASGTDDAVFSRFIIEDKRLAELSMQAHELAKAPAGSEPSAVSRELQAVEAQVDVESAKLWNLTPSDLAEIQRSLKELTA